MNQIFIRAKTCCVLRNGDFCLPSLADFKLGQVLHIDMIASFRIYGIVKWPRSPNSVYQTNILDIIDLNFSGSISDVDIDNHNFL